MKSTDDDTFNRRVRQLTSKYSRTWIVTSEMPPDLPEQFAERQQVKKERELQRVLRALPQSLGEYCGLAAARRAGARALMRGLVTRMLTPGCNGAPAELFRGWGAVTDSFIVSAREFDPSLTDDDIVQALRNLWVFNSIQSSLGVPVALTPSALAYSLLYPCTDNLLDNRGESGCGTEAFIGWLSQRLEGRVITPDGSAERIVDRLLRMIEGEYPREMFPDVHRSLLAIHGAQKKSLLLRDDLSGIDESVLVTISVEKGGTSVLADGYLAGGKLSVDQSEAMFAYGVVLQLIDDLQDIDEDGRRGSSSVFTRAAAIGPLDGIVSRLLNFTRSVVPSMLRGNSISGVPAGLLLEKSCTFLIFEAIARTRASFTEEFVLAIDHSMPVGVSTLARLREGLPERSARIPERAYATL